MGAENVNVYNSEALTKIATVRLMTLGHAGQTTHWSNATEHAAARRLTIETQLAT